MNYQKAIYIQSKSFDKIEELAQKQNRHVSLHSGYPSGIR